MSVLRKVDLFADYYDWNTIKNRSMLSRLTLKPRAVALETAQHSSPDAAAESAYFSS